MKVIKIDHSTPKGSDNSLCILPFGMYCNVPLQKAKIGSTVEFCDGWKREKRVLVRRCKVKVDSSVFTFLLKSIYGEQMRWEDLRKRWEAWAIIEGLGKNGFSDKECLLIEVAPYDEAAYQAEQERKASDYMSEFLEELQALLRKYDATIQDDWGTWRPIISVNDRNTRKRCIIYPNKPNWCLSANNVLFRGKKQ